MRAFEQAQKAVQAFAESGRAGLQKGTQHAYDAAAEATVHLGNAAAERLRDPLGEKLDAALFTMLA